MAGYVRQSSFVDGDTVTAALFNDEYNQLVNAFHNSTGHSHDGTTASGPVIGLIGDAGETAPNNKVLIDTTNNYIEFYVQVSGSPVQQLYIADGAIVPVTDSDIDLGTSSLEFKDLYLDGTAHIDTLDVDANAGIIGNATVGGTLGVTGNTTLTANLTVNGNTTLGNAASDTVTITADVASHIIPSADSTYTLGDGSNYWSHGYVDAITTTGNVAVGGNLTVTGNATISGNLTFGDAASDTVAFSADVASHLLPSADATYDLGASGSEWNNLYIDGTANIDSLVADTADINGGTIDSATIATSDITVGSGKTLDVSSGTFTLAANQISGDKVEGGTIAATTVTTLTSTTGNITNVNATTVDTTNIEVTNIKAKDGTAAGSIADSSGVVTLASSVLTTTDINGGTIDGATVGASSASTGAFTSVTTTGNVSVGGNLDVTGTIDFSDSAITNVGSLQLDSIAGDEDSNTSITFSGSDVITVAAGGDNQVTFTNGAIVPSTDNDIDLGTSSVEFKDAYFDGTVTTDALVADTADINGGTVDGAVIGGASAAAITGTAITGTSFVIGSANISEAELETIDGITAGTVAASKAVVVDGNKDIGTFRNLTIDGTFSDGNYTFDTSGNVSGLGTVASGAITSSGVITGTGFTIGSAVINEAELETIDGITAGTVIASKAIITDANIDITGGRNITISGELDAATLDISGNADIDGTLEADAYTVAGTALNEYIADTVGAMVGSNTETNITVTYEDSDNTLDFVIGTLNQDTTGLAATATALATARTIHGVSFDGTANIDLSEVIADTVGAMVGSNTESGITVAYQDGDNTIDFTVGTLNQDTTGTAALATQTTITANNSTNESVYPVFVDGATGSQGLETDTALSYNPSTNTLTVANISVSGTQTIVDSVTMNANNAVIFEGSTADAHETTLTTIDATGDRTISLPNVSGTLPVLAAVSTTAITSTPEELNKLDGVTSTTAELNFVDGSTAGSVVNSKAVVYGSSGEVAATSATVTGDLTVDTSTLKVVASSNRVGILNTSPDVTLDIGTATDAVHMPVGTTGQRPGSPAAGYLRYNSSLSQFEGYTDAWGAIGGGGTNTFTHDVFTANGSTTAFALSQTSESENNLIVFVDGVFQEQGAYSIATSSGTTTLTMSVAPVNGRKLVVYSVAAGVSGSNLNIDTMTGDGSDTTLTLSIAPVNENNTQVFFDGVYQNKSTYSISSTTLTFSTAPPSGVAVEVMTFTQTEVNVPVDGTITSAKLSGNLTAPGTLTSTGVLTANAGVVVDNFTLDGTTLALSSGDMLVDVAGNITLDADDAGEIRLKDGGTQYGALKIDSSRFKIQSIISDADMIFAVNDGGTEVTALYFDSSAAGLAVFNNGITLTDGDLTVASGHGISFAATSDGGVSTPSELLDDYEEGTFTPTYTVAGGGSAGTVTSTNTGRYTKVGRMITVAVKSHYVPTSGTVPTSYSMTLPFAVGSLGGQAGNGCGQEVAQTGVSVFISVSDNSSTAIIKGTNGASPPANAYFNFGFTYQIA